MYPQCWYEYITRDWSKFTPHDLPDTILVTGTICIKILNQLVLVSKS